MRTNVRRVPADGEAGSRSEAPLTTVPSRGAMERELEGLKDRLFRELSRHAAEPQLHAPLRRAVNEAAALAWLTPYPLLVLPTLAEEKAEHEVFKMERQYEIRERTHTLLARAA